MDVQPAMSGDMPVYVAAGQAAQNWLRSKGLEQYVPAAHATYAAEIRERVSAETLWTARVAGEPVGFFSLDPTPSPWWPPDDQRALYLGGMVVSPAARGRGVGGRIILWCVAEAARRGCRFVRLDCHAGNPKLCRYYETHGFQFRGQVEQQPGYFGCLYQRAVGSAGGRGCS